MRPVLRRSRLRHLVERLRILSGCRGVAGAEHQQRSPACGATFGACDEATDSCFVCTSNANCNDNIFCTNDICNGATGLCTNPADDTLCPDPDFCDGIDTCTPADPDADGNGCLQPGGACPDAGMPICDEAGNACEGCVANSECPDDEDACTADTCDGGTGECNNDPIVCVTTADCPAGCNTTCSGGPPTVCGP